MPEPTDDWLGAIITPQGERYVLSWHGWSGPDADRVKTLNDGYDLRFYPGASSAVESPGLTCVEAAAAMMGGTIEMKPGWGAGSAPDVIH